MIPMINRSNSGHVINAAKLFIILLFCSATPLVVFAQSDIQGNVINAPTKIENSVNIAAGKDNKASQFSIALKNARISGSVVNSAKNKTAVNVAAGKRNVANQSAIIIKNSRISGKLINSSVGNSKVNMALGTDNKADQGSVRIENSRIRSTVINSSTVQQSTNMAKGNSNSASQAAIVMGGTQVSGIAVNDASGQDAINVAVGYKNEANQSSIVVDGDQAENESLVTMPQNTFHTDSGSKGQTRGNILPKARTGQERSILPYTDRRAQDSKKRNVAQHVPGQVVFLVDNDKNGLASLYRITQEYHLNVVEKTVLKSLNRIMVVSATTGDAAEITEALKNESGVYNSQPNYVFVTMGQQDPLSPMQNLVSMLDLQEVHGKVSGKNIIVAIVDTGVEIGHQDLRARIIGYQNFVSGSTYQGEIHGTAVAGIIGADKNEYGIVGIAPDVSLLALRACRQINKMSAKGECFSTSLARSLDAAISSNVDLVNLSLGAHVNDTLLSMMIHSGHEKGIIFAAPVGNDPAAENIAFPASHDEVISVAGLDERGNPLPNKRLASMADAVAPATHLFVTTPGNSYNFIDGTSLASASISGIIALSMEKKTVQNPLCLPRFNSNVPWPKQVFSCLGL